MTYTHHFRHGLGESSDVDKQNNETQQKINVVQSKFIDVNPEQRHNCKSEVVCDKTVINGILVKSYYFVLFDLFDPMNEVTSSMIIQKFVTIKYFFQNKNLQKTLEHHSEKE